MEAKRYRILMQTTTEFVSEKTEKPEREQWIGARHEAQAGPKNDGHTHRRQKSVGARQKGECALWLDVDLLSDFAECESFPWQVERHGGQRQALTSHGG